MISKTTMFQLLCSVYLYLTSILTVELLYRFKVHIGSKQFECGGYDMSMFESPYSSM